ncbi:FMN-dependent NADH-azoreductase [Macrococcus sp. DPC7161]|uniref:FMN-dependent NADH-azoreductase n=1 Tax=Macrococcus sp. DPC7161 TaxID=2507060 RepID=UPI00100B9832|nr:FMN-dependent NADH-azoreductase [Macrococcus sp. DPC7161]RXK18425.1 FMN-dependent NADH-azoreductase [Macrococcus sp. DPC7161]
MAKVLYITGHPNDASVSYSMATGEAFIESYKVANPSDEVVHIDLYNTFIPLIDNEVFAGWGKLQSGEGFETLSETEQQKVARLNELSDEFAAADKYVFVTPMWNLSVPAIVKAYIDAVAVAGKAFKYTESGAVGLLTDKKAVLVQARGGIYSEGPAADFELGNRYLKTILGFFGLPSIEEIIVEGHNAAPDQAASIKAAAIEKATALGKTF